MHAALAPLVLGASLAEAEQAAANDLEDLPPAEREATLAVIRGIDPAALPPGEPEVAMCLDTRTGEARRLDAPDRRYVIGPDDLPGTADLVSWSWTAEAVLIVDWKSRWAADDDHRPQLSLYGLMAARIAGKENASFRVMAIGEAGTLGIADAWDLDWEQLSLLAREARRTWERVEAVRTARDAFERTHLASWAPDVATGPHCRYCDSAAFCPAQTAAVAAMLQLPAPLLLGEDDVGPAYLAALAAERAARRARDAAKLYVEQHGPVPSGDGRRLRLNSLGHIGVGR